MATNESAKFMKNAYVGWTMTAGLKYGYDYDPKKVDELSHKAIKIKKKLGTHKKQYINMTMINPFTFVCSTCGEFNYTGKKSVFKMEPIPGESYKGLRIYRFYGKCCNCSAPWTFRTDPASSGYVLESGGKRTNEANADAVAAEMEQQKRLEEELDEDDAMKELQRKAQEAQEQMKLNEALEQQLMINKREAGGIQNCGGLIGTSSSREKLIDSALATLDFLYSTAEMKDDLTQDQESNHSVSEEIIEDMEVYASEMKKFREEELRNKSEFLNLKLEEEERQITLGSSSSSSLLGIKKDSLTDYSSWLYQDEKDSKKTGPSRSGKGKGKGKKGSNLDDSSTKDSQILKLDVNLNLNPSIKSESKIKLVRRGAEEEDDLAQYRDKLLDLDDTESGQNVDKSALPSKPEGPEAGSDLGPPLKVQKTVTSGGMFDSYSDSEES